MTLLFDSSKVEMGGFGAGFEDLGMKGVVSYDWRAGCLPL